jgi:hypothetical protein
LRWLITAFYGIARDFTQKVETGVNQVFKEIVGIEKPSGQCQPAE